MAELDHYDVVIIGSGAGGGTLAWKPTLTIIANALRVGQHLTERLA